MQERKSEERAAMHSSRQDQSDTYFVQDRSSEDESTRLQIQGHLLTASMGGVLSEQPDAALFQAGYSPEMRKLHMSTPNDPRREYSSTYFVQDRSSQDEFARLQIQDQMVTTSMGGVLPEQPDPTIFQRVLDVGCATGGWLIDVAQTYPTIKQLVGVDASSKMIDYARAQAQERQVSDRVTFRAMDALLILDFPPRFFDLVNQRLGASFLRTWDWPKLLSEYRRVTRPGGVIRITEGYAITCSSPALTRLWDLFLQASYQAGHIFSPDGNGVSSQLPRLLRQYAGLKEVQTRQHTLEYRGGTPDGQRLFEDMRLAFRSLEPFLRKWTAVPDDYHEIYQQMLQEMQQPDFVSRGDLLTAWGNI